jgi:formamidopyrimidine-DNA glycosylase
LPELVDVEGFRRVAEHAVDRKVRTVRTHDAGVLRGVTPARLSEALTGRRFGRPWRHGKWLILPVGGADGELLLHFGMTGSLHWCSADSDRHRHDRVEWELRGGVLRYRDMRKLTGVHLARDADERRALLQDLGPDALSVRDDELTRLLGGRSRQLKAALMDQHVLAGLGSLLVDEILWQARLHPRAPTAQLDNAQMTCLAGSLRKVLRAGARLGRVPDGPDRLTGHREEPDARCPRQGATLLRQRIAGRTTFWCPECQPEPSGR